MLRSVLALILLAGAETPAAASGTVPASYVAALPPGTNVNGVAADSSGNIVLAGQIQPPGADYTASDGFVARVKPNGDLLYLTKIAGSREDAATAVAADAAGDAYICGTTGSSDFPVTPGAWQTAFPAADQGAGFVAKIGAAGNILYATFVAGANPRAITVNAAGEVFVTGYNNTSYAVTPGAPDFGTAKGRFILRLSAAGDRPIFALTGPGGYAIAIDGQSIYTAGSGFDQGDVPTTPNAFQQHVPISGCGGGAQLQVPCLHQYVCKMDLAGTTLAFCTYASGTSGDQVAGLAPDANRDIWLAGWTSSTDFPTTPDAAQGKNISTWPPYPANPPLYPALYQFFPATGYVTKLAGDGSHLLYSSYLGGTQHDQPTGLGLDDTGLYVAALVDSPDFPGPTAGPQWCLPSRLHAMPVLLRMDTASHTIVSETVVEGVPNGLAPRLALDAQHTATVVSGPYLGRVGQVSPALFDPIACITDAVDFTQAAPVAPGQLLTIFGTGIGPDTPAAYDPNSSSLPVTLGGARIEVNGVALPLMYAASGQINFVAPYDAGGAASFLLKLTTPGGAVSQRTLATAPISPGLFTLGVTDYPACGGKGLYQSTAAAVFNEDGSLNSCDHPAAPGSLVSVLLEGTGLMAPRVTDAHNVVEDVAPEFGDPVGVWRVHLRLSVDAHGYAYASVFVDGVPAREQNVAIWVTP